MYNVIIYDDENKETIKLDETMMKRIAKYNKEIEIKQLEKTIENKKEQIKELDDKLQDRTKRWDIVRNFIADIYDLDLETYDDEDYDDLY